MNESRLLPWRLSQCQDIDAWQKLPFPLILNPSFAESQWTTPQWVYGLTAKLWAWDIEPSESLSRPLVCFLWSCASLIPESTCLAGPSFIGIYAPTWSLVHKDALTFITCLIQSSTLLWSVPPGHNPLLPYFHCFNSVLNTRYWAFQRKRK